MVDRIFETVKSVIIDQVINSKKTERLVTNDVKITCSCCMETVSKPRNIMTLEEIKHLLNKDTNKILMELCFRNETDFGNSLKQLIKDIGRFIDKQISMLKIGGNKKGYIRFVTIDTLMNKVIKLQHELISYKNKFTVTNHEGYIYLTDEGKDFFKKFKQKIEKQAICFNPPDILQQIEENTVANLEKKKQKKKAKKKRYKANKKKKEEEKRRLEEMKKIKNSRPKHDFYKMNDKVKAGAMIQELIKDGVKFDYLFNSDSEEEEKLNSEHEKELESFKEFVKCSSPLKCSSP